MIESKEKQEFFMREAIKVANFAKSINEIPIAALVIKDGEIISAGYNRRIIDSDPTAHAEIVALREAGNKLGLWNLSGCDLVVTLEPCAMCAGAIVNARIDNVYFGAYDHRFGFCGSLHNIACDSRLNHRANVVGEILQEECVELLQEFFSSKRGK